MQDQGKLSEAEKHYKAIDVQRYQIDQSKSLNKVSTSVVSRTLLGAKGIATRSKDATSSSWHYY